VLLVDGEIRGTWRPKRSRGKLTLTVEPFAKLTAAHRERLVAAAERLAGSAAPPRSLST
jgi:hypothetical protein